MPLLLTSTTTSRRIALKQKQTRKDFLKENSLT